MWQCVVPLAFRFVPPCISRFGGDVLNERVAERWRVGHSVLARRVGAVDGVDNTNDVWNWSFVLHGVVVVIWRTLNVWCLTMHARLTVLGDL